jgi:hypothetical protein
MAAVADDMRSVGARNPFLSIFNVGGALDGRSPTSCRVDRRTRSTHATPPDLASPIAEARKASEAIPRRAGSFWAMPMDGNARTRFSLGVLATLAHLGRNSRLHAQQDLRFWLPEAYSIEKSSTGVLSPRLKYERPQAQACGRCFSMMPYPFLGKGTGSQDSPNSLPTPQTQPARGWFDRGYRALRSRAIVRNRDVR